MTPPESQPPVVKVERGTRVGAELPGHDGPVGFIASGESAELAYQPSTLGTVASPGYRVFVCGQLWEVTGERGSAVPGMRVLLLRRATP